MALRAGRTFSLPLSDADQSCMQSTSTARLLDWAIANEERAAAFYRYLANQVEKPAMRGVFLGFAKEEEEHKAKLQGIRFNGEELVLEGRVIDLKLSEALEEPPLDLSGDISYVDALTMAIKAEESAHNLYSRLANSTTNTVYKATLLWLAHQEAKHKLRFEVEYEQLRQCIRR